MTKINLLTNILFLLFTILICVIWQSSAVLSDKQLCYDPNCSEIISLGKTTLAYSANDPEIMSFKINADVKIFSKGAGKRVDLWGVEINGKRGFAPKSFLKEYKVLQRDLLHEVPVHKFNDEAAKVHTKKSEFTEKIHTTDSLLKDKLPHDNNEAFSAKSVDKTVQESEMINAHDISPSYEVIDGTTIHFENEPSAYSSFATETMHATALPNEKVLFSADSKDSTIDDDDDYDDDDDDDDDNESIFANSNESQETSDINLKLEGIMLPINTYEEIITKEMPESSEAIIDSSLDTVSKNNLSLDESSRSDSGLSKNSEHENLVDDNSEKDIGEQKKEKVTDTVEAEGIIASFRKRFATSFDSQKATSTSSTSQNNDDTPIAEAVVTKEEILATQTEPELSVDSSESEIEIQQNNIRENNINEKISDGLKKETFTIVLENITLSSDVPSSNNFIRGDVDKSANNVPIASSALVNDNFASVEHNINNLVEDIQIKETSKEEKTIEKIENGDAIAPPTTEKLTTSSYLQETVPSQTIIIQNSNDFQQELSESSGTNLENVKEKIIYKETIDRVNEVASADTVLETNTFSTVKKESESITTNAFPETHTIEENIMITDETLDSNANFQMNEKVIVHNNVNNNDNLINHISSGNVPAKSNGIKNTIFDPEQSVKSSQENIISEEITINELPHNRNLLNTKNLEYQNNHVESQIDSSLKDKISSEYNNDINSEKQILYDKEDIKKDSSLEESISDEIKVTSDEVCSLDQQCITNEEITKTSKFFEHEIKSENKEDGMIDVIKIDHYYWKTLIYLSVTAFTILTFTLGYYYIENIRRDGQLIARINELEKELLVSQKQFEELSDTYGNLKTEQSFFIEAIEDDSNKLVVSLKADLKASQNAKIEMEEQVTMLEKELESATEAGLELERMLREVLSSNNAVNPLAQSVEDLQARLNAQQTANESLTNALDFKAQEIETLSVNLAFAKKKGEELQIEFLRIQNDLTNQKNINSNMEQTLTDKMHTLEVQIKELSTEKSSLYKELKNKEIEAKEFVTVISQINSKDLDLEKLYDVVRVKTEAIQFREERDELQIRLNDVEGAHQLLEEHMKLVKEEIAVLSNQCKVAEKEKTDAETRLEVLSNFFKEKEAERQKEEAIWLEKQGEVVSTVERIHMMQDEIQNYKQQIEISKREIVDQEREYKAQISALGTKAHEQWVAARQNERRLEESKAEAGQLRNRLTLVEKNLNDTDSETKLHRLETNGETTTSPLFIGADSSSSPIMFSASSGVPPPPPSYLHCFPPYLPPLPPGASDLPPYDISQRPPTLGGRLSSPPPMPLHPSASSRSPPPPFSDHIPPPPPGSILPPPLGTTHPWGEESLPPLRNSGFHPQREQRARNHKGSLHSSGDSLDKTHHGKV